MQGEPAVDSTTKSSAEDKNDTLMIPKQYR